MGVAEGAAVGLYGGAVVGFSVVGPVVGVVDGAAVGLFDGVAEGAAVEPCEGRGVGLAVVNDAD